jgi:hypothetical protein
LVVDVASKDQKIMMEFVSARDWMWSTPDFGSTVSEYDYQEQAEWLRRQVAKQAKGSAFGVFYEPVQYVDCRLSREKDEEKEREFQDKVETATAESKRLLRLQVADFIGWLKAQGAL